MKKQFVIIGIIALLVCVGLSGCDEQIDDGGGYSKIALVSHSVVTQATNLSYVTNEPDQDFRWDDIADGFSADKLPILVNDSEVGYKGARYLITGTIKNVADEMLPTIQMDAKFYDENNNYLGAKTQYITNLANNNTRDFRITYTNWDYPLGSNFTKVNRMEFEFKSL